MENLISASEAARRLEIPQPTLSRWLREGRIKRAIKVSNMWLVPDDIGIDDIDRPEMGRPPKEPNGNNGKNGDNE